MPLFITSEQAIAELHVEDGADVPNLGLYMAAACELVEKFLDRPVYLTQAALDAAKAATDAADEEADRDSTWDTGSLVVNATMRYAALRMVCDFAENKEDVLVGTIATELPTSSRRLLQPWRRMGV